jgi:hypothetical protein
MKIGIGTWGSLTHSILPPDPAATCSICNTELAEFGAALFYRNSIYFTCNRSSLLAWPGNCFTEIDKNAKVAYIACSSCFECSLFLIRMYATGYWKLGKPPALKICESEKQAQILWLLDSFVPSPPLREESPLLTYWDTEYAVFLQSIGTQQVKSASLLPALAFHLVKETEPSLISRQSELEEQEEE